MALVGIVVPWIEARLVPSVTTPEHAIVYYPVLA